MKLSEIRPCDSCKGHLTTGSYLIRVSMLLVDPTAARQVLGLNTMFGGRLGLAEVFAPDDNPIKVLAEETPPGESKPFGWTDLLLCQSCALDKLGAEIEKVTGLSEAAGT